MRRAIGLLAVVCVLALAAGAAGATPAITVGKPALTTSSLKVSISCKGAPCKGALKLAAGKTVLATGTYKAAANHKVTATAKLTAEGKTLLNLTLHGKGKPVSAKLTVTVTGGSPQSQSLKFP
jgi:hypothetical protein